MKRVLLGLWIGLSHCFGVSAQPLGRQDRTAEPSVLATTTIERLECHDPGRQVKQGSIQPPGTVVPMERYETLSHLAKEKFGDGTRACRQLSQQRAATM